MSYIYVKPADIEAESMKTISRELAEKKITIPEEELPVVRRVIHTTADFDYAENLYFTKGVVPKAVALLKQGGFTIITDTNMAKSGISRPSLKKLNGTAVCYMADPAIMRAAKEEGTTRAAVSMRHGAEEHPDAIFAVGNAPTALIELSRRIREGLRPSLIVGVPVGFVNVCESKEELIETCEEAGVPAIVARGRKGGSNVAASIMNALLYSATGMLDPKKRDWMK